MALYVVLVFRETLRCIREAHKFKFHDHLTLTSEVYRNRKQTTRHIALRIRRSESLAEIYPPIPRSYLTRTLFDRDLHSSSPFAHLSGVQLAVSGAGGSGHRVGGGGVSTRLEVLEVKVASAGAYHSVRA